MTRNFFGKKSIFCHTGVIFFQKTKIDKIAQWQKSHFSAILKVFLKQSENIEKIDLPKN
jgi:hypothetical protein